MADMLTNVFSEFTRRKFLTRAAGASGAILATPHWVHAAITAVGMDGVDPRVAQVLAKTIGIDMHNHVYPSGTEPHMSHGPQQGPPGQPPPGAPQHEEQAQGPDLLIADELKRSGLTAVCAAFVLDFAANDKPGDARNNFLQWLTAVDEQLAKGHVRRALTLADLQSAHEQGRPVIVQSTEGAQFIEGKVERIEEVYKRGLRHLQLLHMKDDLVSPLGDTNTGVAHLGGLTAFGGEVVKECNRLGIVVDLAHASNETVLGAVKVAKGPFIVSHTSLDGRKVANAKMAEMMKPHLITKDHAKVVADAGGVVGVWTKLADTLPDFVESIKSMVDAIGVDHVGIGTDNDLLSSHAGQGLNVAYPNLSAGFFPAVVGEMLKQGFTPEEIGKVGGGNFCRVFGKVTAGH